MLFLICLHESGNNIEDEIYQLMADHLQLRSGKLAWMDIHKILQFIKIPMLTKAWDLMNDAKLLESRLNIQ